MKKIKIVLFNAYSDCECCGVSDSRCADIISECQKEIKSTTLGFPNCVSGKNAYLDDALNYIFNSLNIMLPYTKHCQKAIDQIPEGADINLLLAENKINYRTYYRFLNKSWKINKGDTLEKTAIAFLRKFGYDLMIIDQTEIS